MPFVLDYACVSMGRYFLSCFEMYCESMTVLQDKKVAFCYKDNIISSGIWVKVICEPFCLVQYVTTTKMAANSAQKKS